MRRPHLLTCLALLLLSILLLSTLGKAASAQAAPAQAAPAQAAPAQAALWKFEPSAGTLTGDAAWLNTAQYGAHAIQLPGQGNLDVPATVIDTRQSFTVSAWVKLRQIGGFQTVVSIDGTTVSGFFLQLRGSGTFGLTMITADRTDRPAAVASALEPAQAGVWYNLVGVHDAAARTITLYVNGVLQQTVPYTGAWSATGHTEIGRGKYAGHPADFVTGEIDDVSLTQSAAVDSAQLRAIATRTHALDSTLTIDVSKPGARLSPLLYGLMIEDISHSIDGGLYAEMIQNRALNDEPNSPAHWVLIGGTGAGTLSLDKTQPVPNTALTNSLRLDIAASGQDAGAANSGYWGIPIRPQTVYHASFYAKAAPGYTGPLTASIQEAIDGTVTASATIPALTPEWKQYAVTLKTGDSGPSTDNLFVLSGRGVGTVWLTQVSLMPPTYHNRPNGSRIDLMQALAGLHPRVPADAGRQLPGRQHGRRAL